MSLTVTPNYAAANAKLSRTPVYKVAFAGIAQQFATHRTASGAKPFMQLPQGSGAIVNPQTGQSSLGTTTFTLMDHGGAITALLSQLNGVAVTFYGGFDTIAETDYAKFATGVVTDITATENLTGYIFTVTDLQQLINKQVFQVSTSALTGAMSASNTDQWTHYVRVDVYLGGPFNVTPGDYTFTSTQNDADWATSFNATLSPGMTWSYYQPSVFINGLTVNLPTTAGLLTGGTRYVLIDSEMISYTSNTGTTLTGTTRGVLGTSIAGHDIGAKVTEVIRFVGHPMDIFLSVLTNTDKTGLSISTASINTIAIAAFKANFNPTMTMDFRITDATNAKTWFENELFAVLASYLTITNSGLISVKQFAAPVSAVTSLTHDNIKRTSGATDKSGSISLTWGSNFQSILNSVQFLYDYDPTTQLYNTTSTTYMDSVSIARYGVYPLVIKSQGLRSDSVLLSTVLAAVAALVNTRYSSGGAPKVTASVFLSKNTIDPGDIISLTSSVLPNRDTGKKGVTNALFEVISRSNLFNAGSVDLELLWTSWNS